MIIYRIFLSFLSCLITRLLQFIQEILHLYLLDICKLRTSLLLECGKLVFNQLSNLLIDLDQFLSENWRLEHQIIILLKLLVKLILFDRWNIESCRLWDAQELLLILLIIATKRTNWDLRALSLRQVEILKVFTELVPTDDDLVDFTR